MGQGVNKWIGVGNLSRDPETRFTQSGKAVCNFSIACNDRWKGEDHVEWVNIVVWDKLAEICGEYLSKGSQVYIEGKLQTSSWDDKETGNKRYKTEVIAKEMVMLSGGQGKKDESGNRPNQDSGRQNQNQSNDSDQNRGW